MRVRDLQSAACVMVTLLSTFPSAVAQQGRSIGVHPTTEIAAENLMPASPSVLVDAPAAQNGGTSGQATVPVPLLNEPLYLRPFAIDYSKGNRLFPNPLRSYKAIDYPASRLTNSPKLRELLRDGKIYLSLNDAVALAIADNYDIAIARINLDIADTDILRAKAGSGLRGVSTGIVSNTLGGSSPTISGGGGPGGSVNAAGSGAGGLVLSTNGGGPMPETLDPSLTGALEYEAQSTPQTNSLFSGGLAETYADTSTYNFGYAQGFLSGTDVKVAFSNDSVKTNNPFTNYSPAITSNFRATVTQHLLQGFGPRMNRRFIVQAKNDRRITDSAFRQQLLSTVNQVENIYWALVSAYEDEQAKERALKQSQQLAEDNRRQMQTGSLAALDVVNSDASVANDEEALVASQSNLEYQQLIVKQALSRNLDDPELADAPVIPTDRVGLDRIPEEDVSVDSLISKAYANNPQIEQASVNMQNNEITIKAERNALLPVVDLYAFYGGTGLGGAQSPNALDFFTGSNYPPGTFPSISYGTAFGHLFDNSAPDKAIGVNVTIPLRNRVAQADQARSRMELRQSEMRLQQLYTQVKIGVINGRYALKNDRAQVNAAEAARKFAAQSLDAAQKKYKVGATTTEDVLQQARNLASAENTLISATAAYAKDRAALRQLLGKTLDVYGIDLKDAAADSAVQSLSIPGLTAPREPESPSPLVPMSTPAPR
ncbi:MAG TPA: TolC family protein [Terracidiphilus sp.]|nr:TolC family protein [Terracidiphilus sp.]